MKKNKKKINIRRLVCILLAIVLLGSVISSALIVLVNGASSAEIKKQLTALRNEQSALKSESDALKTKMETNRSETQTLVEKKTDIDQQMQLTEATITNLNEQIQQYSLLIADKQKELDASLEESDRLNQLYKTRIRTMEENGNISYWSILFGASSFSDLLDKVDMIQEVAESDQLMLKKLAEMSEQIAAERAELEEQMQQLDETKQALDEQKQELESQRAEADELLVEMAKAYDEMSEDYEDYMEAEEEMSKQIAQSESDYYKALSEEEAERIAKLNAQQAQNTSSTATSSGGWVYPLPYTCSVTDSYGYRIHPLSGVYKWHNGVDFAAAEGTSILAARAGTVTTAAYSEAYGYYVVINHGDGFSTMYAHMPSLSVSVGTTVSAGQVIGSVGSTGWSTGPHLHFTVYYNGSDVNPFNYIG